MQPTHKSGPAADIFYSEFFILSLRKLLFFLNNQNTTVSVDLFEKTKTSNISRVTCVTKS